MATTATNCPGATPISCATSTRWRRQQVVEQVVAVVAPHRHLALRMVQRVQRHHLRLVLGAVHPVAHKVEHQQVDPD
jgi:gamma-glutamyl:cysteine ligase YbdK (ATP-grasp superfamily)